MKAIRISFILGILFLSVKGFSQSIVPIRGDTIRVYKQGDSSTLKVDSFAVITKQVNIGKDYSTWSPSMSLKLSDSTRAIRFNRMYSRYRIASPENGMMIYEDSTNTFVCYLAGAWGACGGGGAGTGTVTSVGTNDATGIFGGTITVSGTLAIDTTLNATRGRLYKALDSIGAIKERFGVVGEDFLASQHRDFSGVGLYSFTLDSMTFIDFYSKSGAANSTYFHLNSVDFNVETTDGTNTAHIQSNQTFSNIEADGASGSSGVEVNSSFSGQTIASLAIRKPAGTQAPRGIFVSTADTAVKIGHGASVNDWNLKGIKVQHDQTLIFDNIPYNSSADLVGLWIDTVAGSNKVYRKTITGGSGVNIYNTSARLEGDRTVSGFDTYNLVLDSLTYLFTRARGGGSGTVQWQQPSSVSWQLLHPQVEGDIFMARQTNYGEVFMDMETQNSPNIKYFQFDTHLGHTSNTDFFTLLENFIYEKVYNRIYMDSLNGIHLGTKINNAHTYKGIGILPNHMIVLDSVPYNSSADLVGLWIDTVAGSNKVYRKTITGGSGVNIYNTSARLTADRVLSGFDTYTLTLDSLHGFYVNTSSGVWDIYMVAGGTTDLFMDFETFNVRNAGAITQQILMTADGGQYNEWRSGNQIFVMASDTASFTRRVSYTTNINGSLHGNSLITKGYVDSLFGTAGGTGTVTSFAFTDGNGFDGTVTNPTTTPTLSLTTTVTPTYVMYAGTSGAITGDANFIWDAVNSEARFGGVADGGDFDIQLNKGIRVNNVASTQDGIWIDDGTDNSGSFILRNEGSTTWTLYALNNMLFQLATGAQNIVMTPGFITMANFSTSGLLVWDGNNGVATTTNPARRLQVLERNNNVNSVQYLQRLTQRSTPAGTIVSGIGVGMEFEVETSDDNYEIGMTVETATTDVTATSEDFDYIVKLMAAGAAATEKFRVKSTGQLQAVAYTSSTSFTGTGVAQLQVDASGNILTAAISGGAAHVIQEEGSSLTARANLNFVGGGITATDDAGNDQTDVTLASQLNTFAAYNTNGLFTQTAAGTYTGRTITGTTEEISVSNGDGVAGNPTLSIPATFTLNGKAVAVQDNNWTMQDNTTTTKKLQFELSGITAATTRTLTIPDASGTILLADNTATITNKRITKRSGSTTSSATPTINTDNVDIYLLTAQAVDITSFTTNLSGTPTEGQTLWIAITGTATRNITWGASFESSDVTLPTATNGTVRLDVGFTWNTATSKWRCVAKTF